jgi:hypothetical protein
MAVAVPCVIFESYLLYRWLKPVNAWSGLSSVLMNTGPDGVPELFSVLNTASATAFNDTWWVFPAFVWGRVMVFPVSDTSRMPYDQRSRDPKTER